MVDATAGPPSFIPLVHKNPHTERARAMLRAHPELRRLMGPAPTTFIVIVSLVVVQFTAAYFVRDASIWGILACAYTVGAVCNASLFNLMHECCHGLVFRTKRGNRLAAFVANLPVPGPAAESFFKYHNIHHKNLAIYAIDFSIQRKWEAKLSALGPLGKAIWLAMYPVVYPFRVHFVTKAGGFFERWSLFNLAIQLTMVATVWTTLGGRSLAYLALSFLVTFGLHPLNANTISEHFYAREGQDSYSNYGKLGNLLTFNMGYHNEHHDLPNVAWSRIARVRKIAPEFYDPLFQYESWGRLVLRFVFDPSWSVWKRGVRA